MIKIEWKGRGVYLTLPLSYRVLKKCCHEQFCNYKGKIKIKSAFSEKKSFDFGGLELETEITEVTDIIIS